MLVHSGYSNISVTPKDESRSFIKEGATGMNIEDYSVSAVIKADKA